MSEDWTLESLMASIQVFEDNKTLLNAAKPIFEYTQFLLDDDENLTKTGNLNKSARDLLRQRVCDVLNIPMESRTEAEPNDP